VHLVSWVLGLDRFCNAILGRRMRVVPVPMPHAPNRHCGIARNWRCEAALIRRSPRRRAGILDPDRLAGASFMPALSTRLTSKRLYIADLAARLDAMESGRTPMNAVAYRLYARRLEAVVSAYPAELLATQFGRSQPAVSHAIEQRQFENDGMLGGRGSARALVRTATLLRRLRHERP
jgi:hypothetical protein